MCPSLLGETSIGHTLPIWTHEHTPLKTLPSFILRTWSLNMCSWHDPQDYLWVLHYSTTNTSLFHYVQLAWSNSTSALEEIPAGSTKVELIRFHCINCIELGEIMKRFQLSSSITNILQYFSSRYFVVWQWIGVLDTSGPKLELHNYEQK